MNNLDFWQFILQRLQKNEPVMLLVVAESEGSSPGRAGFKMAIGADDVLSGSIGGGIMEVKLVELGKKMMRDVEFNPLLKKQIHSKNVSLNQSGMICSGEQTVLYYLLTPEQQPEVEKFISLLNTSGTGLLTITYKDGVADWSIIEHPYNRLPIVFEKTSEHDFNYRENIGNTNDLYIIGGGHCALALSELMSKLNFFIHVLDDRPNLNTLEQNQYAHLKHFVHSFDDVDQIVPAGEEVYIVVMTQGYRTDMQALMSLREKQFGYLGVLGSETKIALMRNELKDKGFPAGLMESMHAPIGLPINSHTPAEIAVSIAAEIIAHRNR